MTTKKWTVMVYLAGDNNLDGAGVSDLNEMKQVGTNDDFNVVAQFDRAGAGVATTRYCLQRGTPLADDARMSLGETDMGDPAVLQSFLDWGIDNYPAERYAMVLWNHGNGWDDTNIYRAARVAGLQVTRRAAVLQEPDGAALGRVPSNQVRAVSDRFARSLFAPTVQAAIRARGIAYDDQAKDFLDNVEVKAVFRAVRGRLGRKVDLLGMDACLMNMLEVAYQVRESVAYVAGSEESEPGAGWPYHRILTALAANPAMGPAELGAQIVTDYLASYGAADGVTQSALDLGQVVPVRTAVEKLGQQMARGLQAPAARLAILDARRAVRHYAKPEYVDLVDLCQLIAAASVPAVLKTACNEVVAAVKPFVVRNGSKGSAVSRSNGVSIYFPTDGVSPLYKTLDFAKQSQWAKFVAAYQA